MKKRKGNGPNGRLLVWWIGAVGVIATASLGYLWQQTEIHGLGREMKKLEVQLDDLRRTNERLSRRYAEMTTPRALDRRVRELGLGLAAPQPSQIVRMSEPSGTAKEWAGGQQADYPAY